MLTRKQFHGDLNFLFNYLELDLDANGPYAFLNEEDWVDWRAITMGQDNNGHCFESWYSRTAACTP